MQRRRGKTEASSRRSSTKVLRALLVSPSQVSSNRSSSPIPTALLVSPSQVSSNGSSSTIPRALLVSPSQVSSTRSSSTIPTALPVSSSQVSNTRSSSTIPTALPVSSSQPSSSRSSSTIPRALPVSSSKASSGRSSSETRTALPISSSKVSSGRSSSAIPRALPVSSSKVSSGRSSSAILRALPVSSSQGKRKVDSNPIHESSHMNCGICLVGPIRSILGRIDGCDHQFCFVCIMEWAKVDSRCPLCRGRFGSVCRSAMPGLFSSDRIVKVPQRDQVHNPYEGENVTMSEPNPNTNCTICNSNKDKGFLKLCNLCNTNSHTYCTGHGYTVPDAKWYCPDCEICRVDHQRYKPEEQQTLERIRALRNGDSCMNLDDFVGGKGKKELVRAIGLVPSSINLSNDQRVEDRLNSIRSNWSLIRCGDLEFKPGFVNPKTKDKIEDERKKGRKREANKAWKMLDKAKTHRP